MNLKDFKQIANSLWEIPAKFRKDMRVPARIYANSAMLEHILSENAIAQLVNVATLPGIEKFALAMPDIHQGYGFPIGGVAAIRAEDGVISPGGVGYDINCGVRLLTSPYNLNEIKPKIAELATQIQRAVPSGVGQGGHLTLTPNELNQVLNQGSKWLVQHGYGFSEDLAMTESQGYYQEADATYVSDKAKKRGADQLGTLGAGNHFLEIQAVTQIYDAAVAEKFNLSENQIVIMVHTGSRGLGHQVCTDYVKRLNQKINQYKIHLPDRELICAPFHSEDGQAYFKAMAAAANFAWANRQLIMDHIREAWLQVMGGKKQDLQLVYDVAHNIAKLESQQNKKYIVHRKGATRAFGPNHPELPQQYKATGQPVLIPGSMGTASYVLVGTQTAMENTFGSTCHGAGRQMSRAKAKRTIHYERLLAQLKAKNIVVRAHSVSGLVEEAPEAYKDIESVVAVVHENKIARKVAKLKPVAIIKG